MPRETGDGPPQHDVIHIVDPNLRQGFAQVPRPVLKARRLSDKAKIVYALLLDYAWQTGSCFPGQEKLAEDLGTSERTIRRALDELKDNKLVSWKQRGLSLTNVYYILNLAESKIWDAATTPPEPDRTKMSTQDRSELSAQGRPKMSRPDRTQMSDKEYPEQYTQREEDSVLGTSRSLPSSKDSSSLKFKGRQAKKNTEPEVVENEPDLTVATEPPRGETGSFARVGSILSQQTPTRAKPTRPPAPAIAQGDQLSESPPKRATQLRASPAAGTAERQALRMALHECAAALDDWDFKLDSCVSRAGNLYQRSGLAFVDFEQRFRDAKWATRERRQGMAYFFTVLEDYCGLREQSPTLHRDPSSTSSARAPAARRRKTVGGPMVRVVRLRNADPDDEHPAPLADSAFSGLQGAPDDLEAPS